MKAVGQCFDGFFARSRRNPRGFHSAFDSTDGVVEMVEDAYPDESRVDFDADQEGDDHLVGHHARWLRGGSGYIVDIDVERIMLTEGNPWYPEHAAGVAKAMRDGVPFNLPAARVYRITAKDVKDSIKAEKDGKLLYEYSMVRPWSRADIGQYYAQLLDGNHRAVAAMSVGESSIPVHVGPNYRDAVRKKDWL